MPTRDALRNREVPRHALPLNDLPAGEAFTLLALARLRCSRTALYWEKAVEWLANNSRSPSWLDLQTTPGQRWREMPQDGALWRAAWRAKSARYEQVQRPSELLHVALVAAVREVVASSRYVTEGVSPDYSSAKIPRDKVQQLTLDLLNSTMGTSRGMTWENVTVRRRQLGKPPQEEIDAWYKLRVKNWPGTKPPPDRNDDQRDAQFHFKCKGLRNETRSARDKLAPEHWTADGPKGRKKAIQAEARAKLFDSAAAAARKAAK